MFLSLKRIFRHGWNNVKRQSAMTFSAIVLTWVSLSLVAVVLFLRGFASHAVVQLREQIDVSVYFKEGTAETDIFAAKDELEKLSEVKAVEYVSSEEALENFRTKFADDPVITESLAEVGRNPFLAALTIKVWDPPQYAAVVNFLEASAFEKLIESIDYRQNRELIERLFAITRGAMRSMLAFGATLGLIAFLVIFGAVRLAIANNQKEIEIMKLVGADRFFVTGPFLVQGAIIGFAAGFAVLALFALAAFFAGKPIETWTAGFHPFKYLLHNFFLFFSSLVIGGGALGVLSSWLAVRKYLR